MQNVFFNKYKMNGEEKMIGVNASQTFHKNIQKIAL